MGAHSPAAVVGGRKETEGSDLVSHMWEWKNKNRLEREKKRGAPDYTSNQAVKIPGAKQGGLVPRGIK